MLKDIPFRHFVYQELDKYRVINFCENETKDNGKLLISTKPCSTMVNGKQIVATALPTPWFRPAKSSSSEPSGSYYIMLKEASQRLNFTFSVTTMKGTGAKVNGIWTGAMGDILYRRVDIALLNGILRMSHPIPDTNKLALFVL